MPTLELQRPFETTEPRLRVENILLPGRHRFRLIVVDNDGIESDPVETLITIVGPLPSSDAFGRAREARGRVFYATGVLLDAQHLDAQQLYEHRWLARALSYLHGSGTLAGLEVTWEQATGSRSERLIVKPGIALDPLGRIIEVPRDADLPLDRWFDGQSDAHLIGAFKPSVQGVVADVFVRLVPGEPGEAPRSAYEVKLHLRQEPEPPPLPPPAWPVFTRTDGARRELQDAIFVAWHEGDDSSDQGGPKSLPEHVPGQDPTSVFLARLLLPATLPATGGRPIRTAGEVVVDNRSRRFVYPPAALARWVGL
ncbi:MAG TPA: hypothetical protein VN953_03045 [Gemmatimonadales bacterium]|nr:hypothetical protein [Gemmatimonadales bacterium]